jgi:voltage-gated potassium channel
LINFGGFLLDLVILDRMRNYKVGLFIEGIILVLMLSDIFLLTSLLFFNVSPQVYTLIVYFDLCVVLILIPEFMYRFSKADDKKQFMRSNWTDILGMIPEILVGPVSTVFRYFRLIRIIKIIALFKKEIRHLLELIHKTKIDYGIFIVLLILLSSATVLYFIEFGVNPDINSYDDALWYLLVTVTTVGYGDIYPKTEAGRVIGTIIMFTGIGFMSFLTATITSVILKSNNNNESDGIHEKLDQLHSEIDELKEIIRSK